MKYAIEVRGLEKKYGSKMVLKGLDLQIEKGEIFALLGVNGAGKTTTLQTISGLITPKSGSITFEGKNLSLNLIYQIAVDLDDLLLPYFFDLSIKEKITNPDLLDHIKRVGMEFYSLKSS